MKARRSTPKAVRNRKPRVYTSEHERNLHVDFEHKHVSIPPPAAIGDVLNKLLARKGYARAAANAGPGRSRTECGRCLCGTRSSGRN